MYSYFPPLQATFMSPLTLEIVICNVNTSARSVAVMWSTMCIRHTCLSLADCASYLMDKLGFLYVLLRHLQSDTIESRFDWLRQLSGANYFISVKQVLDSDKKIRALSLLKFSGLSVKDIDDAIQSTDQSQSTADSAADSVADSIAESLTVAVLERCQQIGIKSES